MNTLFLISNSDHAALSYGCLDGSGHDYLLLCKLDIDTALALGANGIVYWEADRGPAFHGRSGVVFTDRRKANGNLILEVRRNAADPASVAAEGSIPEEAAGALLQKNRACLVTWLYGRPAPSNVTFREFIPDVEMPLRTASRA